MANQSQWQEAYWLPLLQLYLRKPVGMKPLYSRLMIDLALELNVAPKQRCQPGRNLANRLPTAASGCFVDPTPPDYHP